MHLDNKMNNYKRKQFPMNHCTFAAVIMAVYLWRCLEGGLESLPGDGSGSGGASGQGIVGRGGRHEWSRPLGGGDIAAFSRLRLKKKKQEQP